MGETEGGLPPEAHEPSSTEAKAAAAKVSGAEIQDDRERKEAEKWPDIKVFITDHSLRHSEQMPPERLRELYAEMKKEGLASIRFDWDWDETNPAPGEFNQEVAERYVGAMKIMREVGLEAPTLVFSTPPDWALKLYEKDKDAYFSAYGEYVKKAAETLSAAGLKVEAVQIFNEVNHPFLYQFAKAEDLPRAADSVKEAFATSQPDLKLVVGVVASNIAEAAAEMGGKPKVMEFLKQLEAMKDHFDVVAVDYYPGMWHYPLKFDTNESAFPIRRSANPIKEAGNVLNRTFKNTELLREVCQEISGWGKDYMIGEAGFPTNEPYSQGRRQRLFYDMFFRGLHQMLVDFEKAGRRLPSRVGLYETQDEENRFGGLADKILEAPVARTLKKLSPFPEEHFGLRTKAGEKKEILQGRLKSKRPLVDRAEELSQLQNLIHYINRPAKKSKN